MSVGLSDSDCVRLLQWACPRLGLRWHGFRRVRGQVCKRIARRMAALQITSVTDYQGLLDKDPAERAELDAACRVTISRFYRDRAVFDALRFQHIPALARRATEERRTLRIWSAGCCSGEEPYTLAILLHLAGLPHELLASDADPRLLERARRACYPPGALADLPREWQTTAFDQDGRQRCLKPEFRQHVRWVAEDLRYSVPDGPFDLILCRNVAFTYFDLPLQTSVGRQLVERLVRGGLLAIGTHERLPEGIAGLRQLDGRLPLYERVEATF